MIKSLKNEESVPVNLFGKQEEAVVFSTGSNQFDENGDYKKAGFPLSRQELDCLNWFLENVDIRDYKKEITAYCNEQYEMIGDEQITEADLESEIHIFAIAVNIGGVSQSKDGFLYPEISFFGDCECDPEHGICIGFRDKKFLGVEAQDWTL